MISGQDVQRRAARLVPRIEELLAACAGLEADQAGLIAGLRGNAGASARNLLHYLALRRTDLRDLSEPLAELGLSSLGRAEGRVAHNLMGVRGALRALSGMEHDGGAGAALRGELVTLRGARALLRRRTDALLGRARHAGPRIMVTLPSTAASDGGMVRELLESGMSIARINTAHDDAEAWEAMARRLGEQAAAVNVECRVLLDLAGPKIRTCGLGPGPAVVRVKPERDVLGRTVVPGTLEARAEGAPAGAGGASVPAGAGFVAGLRAGDVVAVDDARGRRRVLRVTRAGRSRALLSAERTVYVQPGARLRLISPAGREAETRVGEVPSTPAVVRVRVGDRLRLVRDRTLAGGGEVAGSVTAIGCTLPEALTDVRVGEAVFIDDGKIGARVVGVDAGGLDLEITRTPEGGGRVREDKGINLPESSVPVSGLTEDDVAALPLAVEHADMVGLSFVQRAADVAELRSRLMALGGRRVGVVLKIETRRAFDALPSLLLEALRGPPAGVMIARGDLAVEVGYERLAEVQEEILWLCEAAHVPVVWATQVLETMAKTGQPSRAEVTDAAMAQRAECVMLNKGPRIVEAVRFLDDLLRRMSAHQSKKRPTLRALGVARRFGGAGEVRR
jgi:pyruvate kinase